MSNKDLKNEEDLDSFHDTIFLCFGVSFSNKNLNLIYHTFSQNLVEELKHWGFSDTLLSSEIIEFVKTNDYKNTVLNKNSIVNPLYIVEYCNNNKENDKTKSLSELVKFFKGKQNPKIIDNILMDIYNK